ncbi:MULTISPECIES: transferase [unclassified Coleofasciculus]|uniref:transferase n=1 Tax=unclassified Coleofasciculus TaxID=2692782 RepID=UPI00187F7B6B|nr:MULTISPECIES: transferase [unclassified Coleofasciculus]MBE9126029.1 transferase [Coleofasciculus sp. LEGE 07081]MBE9148717.1 transferase [Coleofasciculus sp. LEGE 07092]
MHLPSLPLSRNADVYVEGDVSIDPSAAIATGVILRADPDSQIIIAAGVCIGAGSILHAYQGTLEVEACANLGAGVLILGKGKIGANASVGALTTIYNASLAPAQVVPATSVVGDRGRQVTDFSPAVTDTPSAKPPEATSASASTTNEDSINGQSPIRPGAASDNPTDEDSSTVPTAESPNPEAETSVYGQGSLDRILKTLFPYNK